MADKKVLIEKREEYIELIKKDLLGPGSEVSIPDEEHEIISDSPDRRYSIGVLFTKNTRWNVDSNDTQFQDDKEEATEVEEDILPESTEEQEENTNAKENNYEESDEDNSMDEEVGMSTQNMPSSMGITFFVKGDTTKIKLNASFATYRRAKVDDCRVPFEKAVNDGYEIPSVAVSSWVYIDKEEKTLRLARGGLKKSDISKLQDGEYIEADTYNIFPSMYSLYDQLNRGYVRIPHSCNLTIDFSESDYTDDNRELDGTSAQITALRRCVGNDVYSVTVMLVNDCDKKSAGEYCILQPELLISTRDNDFVFVDYSDYSNVDLDFDKEELALNMQYRKKKIYGTGLGTSCGWNINLSGEGDLYTDYVPIVEVPSMDFNLPKDSGVPNCTLSMKYLSDLNSSSRTEKINNLYAFVKAYGTWIDNLETVFNELEEKYKEVGRNNINGCKSSFERMKNGVSILEANDEAFNAFQLANRAMFMQRAHIKLQEKYLGIYPEDDVPEFNKLLNEIDYYTVDQEIEDYYAWRPFQLAFILLSLASIVDDKSPDRDIVDLIWFPTGGGKTEAYLGLTAFTIFHRRLSALDVSDGTSIIMRYTLRLLAAQQFTRASTLICACEYIRLECLERRSPYPKYKLGSSPITIGLWIGNEHTPGKNEDAEKKLNKLNNCGPRSIERDKEKYNRFQVLKCPWCGTKMVKDQVNGRLKGTFGYKMIKHRFRLCCPQPSCFYNSQECLPIQIVDEELYKNPPTLLFGTVDKFAMLPWNEKIGNFFASYSNNKTPDLIIQDELHLISGPLGSMVGLYETAVDAICSKKNAKIKVIASTATIRRANEQCKSLYNRTVSQFPHPGLDADDSFFAHEDIINHSEGKYGRTYVGVMPSGKTKAMMEIRCIGALLQRVQDMDMDDETKDCFWTLTAYFNNLKDLGKCTTLVEDDIKDAIRNLSKRPGRSRRTITSADELTSRINTTNLNTTLEKLEKIHYSKENIDNKKWPSNILLATNMISVGIDVSRLNVMFMVGQPKLTSEYIQASSRVGRSFPGVVFTMYDGGKSRDRSFYEQFKNYHESYYKYVEPTGVTPFSEPALERALHAIIVSVLRQYVFELSGETDAGRFKVDDYIDVIDRIKSFVVNRNKEVIEGVNPSMENDSKLIEKIVDEFLDKWDDLAEKYGDNLAYGNKYLMKTPDEGHARVLKVFEKDNNDNNATETMTSMRNVDKTVHGNVLIWED